MRKRWGGRIRLHLLHWMLMRLYILYKYTCMGVSCVCMYVYLCVYVYAGVITHILFKKLLFTKLISSYLDFSNCSSNIEHNSKIFIRIFYLGDLHT